MRTLARRTILGLLARTGRAAETVARHAGQMTLLTWRVARATLTGQVALRDVLIQLQSIGVGSIPLVAVTAILSGVVTSQQGGCTMPPPSARSTSSGVRRSPTTAPRGSR